MRKLKLDLGSLSVQSFTPASTGPRAGIVPGSDACVLSQTCPIYTEEERETCGYCVWSGELATCEQTCEVTGYLDTECR